MYVMMLVEIGPPSTPATVLPMMYPPNPHARWPEGIHFVR
jgi:hypothetical protein